MALVTPKNPAQNLLIPAHVRDQKVAQKAAAALRRDSGKRDDVIRRPFSVRNPIGKRATIMIEVEHKEDPKAALFKRIGTVPDGVVQFNRILVAIYQPPAIDKVGSVYITEQFTEEDKQENLWQGKVGLVVARGAQAYVDDDNTKFYGTENKVGDWVWFRPSDGIGCDVNEVFCRILCERDIIGRIPHPDYVW